MIDARWLPAAKSGMIPGAMKALWANDIHMEFLDDRQRDEFLRRLAEADCDCLLLGGDIGTARTIVGDLNDIQRTVRKPVYFVLGNHDFYHGSIPVVRMAMEELGGAARWLCGVECVPLTDIANHGLARRSRAGEGNS